MSLILSPTTVLSIIALRESQLKLVYKIIQLKAKYNEKLLTLKDY